MNQNQRYSCRMAFPGYSCRKSTSSARKSTSSARVALAGTCGHEPGMNAAWHSPERVRRKTSPAETVNLQITSELEIPPTCYDPTSCSIGAEGDCCGFVGPQLETVTHLIPRHDLSMGKVVPISFAQRENRTQRLNCV